GEPVWLPFAEALVGGQCKTKRQRIGPYEILGALGRGGMGVVYHARDITRGIEVALKTLPPLGHLDPEARSRFAREVSALRRLDDDFTARAIDTCEIQGVHLLVMEYVEGPTFEDLVAHAGPLAVGEACGLIAQVARALHHAHLRQVIHRDVKPANLKRT